MLRVRLHGRGGQGMKTAARLLGTAALLEGLEAQDSPIYGAERRGAPMAAFVRIARGPIRERGAITAPDLVGVADDTLLDDPAAQPLDGLDPAGVLLVATAHRVTEVARHTGHRGPIVGRDFLSLALGQGGGAGGRSTALAAAAGALVGLADRAVDEAIRRELPAIGLRPEQVAASLCLAASAREGIVPNPRLAAAVAEPGPTPEGSRETRPAGRPAPAADGGALVEVAYAAPGPGTPSVVAEPNTPLRRTGSWRVYRPVIDLARCTRCWICFVRCPDGAIGLEPDATPRIDYAVCKGCLICVEECPTHAIARVLETREWPEAEAVR